MTVTRRDALLTAGGTAIAAGFAASSAAAAGATTTPAPSPSASVNATPAPTATATATPTPTPTATAPSPYPLRLTDLPVRDPYIRPDAASGLYHLYSANNAALSGAPAVGTMVSRSPDLQHWSKPQAVFQVSADLWGQNGGWAPEVHRWKGHWYLFVTLHNPNKPIQVHTSGSYGIPVQTPQFERGTVIARSDSLLGPFTVIDPAKPVAPADFMTLDGTLFSDEKGKPWMVYAHEWVQKLDGTIEAVPLKDDLSGAAGKPIHLFKGSDAGWLGEEIPSPSVNQILPYVTDGPQLSRLPGGALAMLWSTYDKNMNMKNGIVSGGYVQTSAISPSGKLKGPWIQQRPLLKHDSGHGMVFRTLATKDHPSRPMFVVHRRAGGVAHPKLYEIEVRRSGFRLGKQRNDLDGSA